MTRTTKLYLLLLFTLCAVSLAYVLLKQNEPTQVSISADILSFVPSENQGFLALGKHNAWRLDSARMTPLANQSPLRLTFVHANSSPLTGREPQGEVVRYHGAHEERQPLFGEVVQHELYPGIDWVLYDNNGRLEYDLRLQAGVSADAIKLRVEQADRLWLADDGALHAMKGPHRLRQAAPFAYQMIDGRRRTVASRYHIDDEQTVHIQLAAYDPHHELVIDPVVESSFSYVGGENNETIYALAVDEENNVFLTGSTSSTRFDGVSATRSDQSLEVFLLKLGADGRRLLIFFGGSAQDIGRALVTEGDYVYVAGETRSDDLPIVDTDSRSHGKWDGFVAKFRISDGALLYSAYVGGSEDDFIHAIAADTTETFFATGSSRSADLETTANAFTDRQACRDNGMCDGASSNAFLLAASTKNTGSQLFAPAYFSYLGGSADDRAHAIHLDDSGIAHLVGETRSADFPLVKPLQDKPGGDYDAFYMALDIGLPNDRSLLASGVYGGFNEDSAHALAMDRDNNLIIVGGTDSDNLTVTANALQKTCGSCPTSDAFVLVLDPLAGRNGLRYASYFGGDGVDVAHAIAGFDDNPRLVLAGSTRSSDLGTTRSAMKDYCGTRNNQCRFAGDGFLLQLDPSLPGRSGIRFASYVGGDESDNILALATAGDGRVFLGGDTTSSGLASAGAMDDSCGSEERRCKIDSADGSLISLKLPANDELSDDTTEATKRVKRSALSPWSLLLLLFIRRWKWCRTEQCDHRCP